MKRVLFGIFFFFTLLISVVVHLPAHVGLGFITPLPVGIKLDGLSGSFWNGSAASFHWNGQSLGTLQWDLGFLRLFTGKVDLTVKLSGVAGLALDGHVGYGFSGAYGENVKITVPATMVNRFISLPVPLTLSGAFNLSLTHYQIEKPLCSQLSGNLTWAQAQIVTQIGTVDPGPVAATLSCNAGSILMKGKSNSDAIETEFNVTLAPNQSFSLQGSLKPGTALPSGIKSQLSWLGAPDSTGFYKLDFNG